MHGTDDIAPLLVPTATPGVRYGTGEVIAWNPDTFENTILWNGLRLTNVRLLSGTDALSYAPGQTLVLMGIDSSGDAAFTQWIIMGRLFTPGTDNTEALIDFLRGTLAKQISAEIFAGQIFPNSVAGGAVRTGLTFGDPDTGDPGPTVVDVPITAGVAIVMMSANMKFSTEDSVSGSYASAGYIGYAVSGATTIPAADDMIAASQKYNNSGLVNVDGVNSLATVTSIKIATGLNPGLHTFAMKYKNLTGATENFEVAARSIVVIGF